MNTFWQTLKTGAWVIVALVMVFVILGLVGGMQGCTLSHDAIHAQHMHDPAHNPYAEPPGYAQPGPNPLEGDHYGHDKKLPDEPLVQVFEEPRPLEKEHPVLRCSKNIVYVEAVEIAREILPNGLLSRVIDATTEDQMRQRIAALYPITYIDVIDGNTVDVGTTTWPTMYLVDLDYDPEHRPDAAYTDKRGEGKCDDIQPYQRLPKAEEEFVPENFDSRREGNI